MSAKPSVLSTCLLATLALALPACGGSDETTTTPASQSVPPEQVQGMEKRVGELEEEVRKLRQDLEGVRNEQSKAEEAGDDSASADPEGSEGSDGAPDSSGGTGAAAGGSGAGTGSGSGSGSGAGSGSGGNEGGGGPDPGSGEADPSIEDICGPNPAPEC